MKYVTEMTFLPLVAHLAVTTSHKETFGKGLELRDDFWQLFITHVFQSTQNTSSEKYLYTKKEELYD